MTKSKFLPLALVLIFTGFLNAQTVVGHLTVFSEEGDKFFLILNGERQNDKAQTNMRVEDLTQPQYSTKVIFDDQSLGEITKTLFLNDPNGALMDVTYKIKRDKNGKPKLGALPFSAVPVRQGYVAPSNVYVVHSGAPVQTTTVTTPASTTVTQTTTTRTGETVNANVNVGGIGMNVTINDPLLNTTATTTTTTRTTTSTQSTTPPAQVGCNGAYPMSSTDFTSALTTIKNQGFSDTQLKTAKQIAGSNCLSAAQVVEICKIFGFEETKLDFAKFAYDYCTEKRNYFKVNGVFGFSSSSDELNEYIQSRH